MQRVANNINKLIATSNSFQLWRENKYLVLHAKGPVERIELPPYCICCGQLVNELTNQFRLNYVKEEIPTKVLVVGVLVLLMAMGCAYVIMKSNAILLISLILLISFVLGVIIFSYQSLNKSPAINLYYGLCLQYTNKHKKIARLKRLTDWLFMVTLLMALIYPNWLDAIFVVMFLEVIWMKLDTALNLYKTHFRPDSTIDYYLSGGQQPFFEQLTSVVKDSYL